MRRDSLTVEEALRLAEMADRNLDTFEATAPKAVKAMGGRDALARRSQNCCLGPMPKLTVQEWCAMSEEYEDTRQHGSINRGTRR